MKFALLDQTTKLPSYLPGLKGAAFSYDDPLCFPEQVLQSRIPCPLPGDLREANLDFLFHYDVFPKHILTFFGEWELENREMRMGDVIVQQTQIPPSPVGFRFIFGVRVLSAYRTGHKAGFAYGTLIGHPETGTNEFYFLIENGCLFAGVRTTAVPGLFLTRLLSPIFTRRYVRFCNGQALERMKENFLKHNFTNQLAGGATCP